MRAEVTQSPNPTWVGIAAGLPCCFEAKRVLGFFRVSQSDQAGLLGALGTAPGFLSAVYCYIIYFDLFSFSGHFRHDTIYDTLF